jgi:hypothetical protein
MIHGGSNTSEATTRCSFCGKGQAEVRKLIAGPTAFICNECTAVAATIMRGDQELSAREMWPRFEEPADRRPGVVRCRMCGLQLPANEALIIHERGFLCAGCCGEIEASLARQREHTT